MLNLTRGAVLGLVIVWSNVSPLSADDTPATPIKPTGQSETAPPSPADAVALNPQKTVFLDAARKRLLLKAQVSQREAPLEMFLCKAGTKEHETIVALESDAYVVHAGLLAIGAKLGEPVQYTPEYKPPKGQIIDVFVNWTDDAGRPQRVKAQSWIRNLTRRYFVEPLQQLPDGFTLPEKTELRFDPKRGELIWFGPMSEAERDRHLALSDAKEYQTAIRKFFKDSQFQEMEADFVFAGSGFVVDEDGKRHYMAESGNIICVANFSDATLDIAMRSTAENSNLMFEPYTERIPEPGTEVTVELVPRKPEAPDDDDTTRRPADEDGR